MGFDYCFALDRVGKGGGFALFLLKSLNYNIVKYFLIILLLWSMKEPLVRGFSQGSMDIQKVAEEDIFRISFVILLETSMCCCVFLRILMIF